MAATAITPTKSTTVTSSPGTPRPGALAAIDATNGNSFINTGREVLLLLTDANTRTVAFFDTNGKQVGAEVALAASKLYTFGPFKVYDYGNPLVFKVSNAAVTAAVISIVETSTFGSPSV